MTRAVLLFEDGTAMVDGIEADALGDAPDLPFLSDNARLAAAKVALANDDWDAAEAASARGVVSASEGDTVTVAFVAPPDWGAFGTSLWDDRAGATHAVFHSTTILVDGVAVKGCVGQPFVDDAARRDCAAWCLRNGLHEIAVSVSRTPVGGGGPFCTWPDRDLGDVEPVDHSPPRRARRNDEADEYEWDDLPDHTETASGADDSTRARSSGADLYGAVFGASEL